MIKRWLIRFGLWLARANGWMPPSPEPLLTTARELVQEQQRRWSLRAGETKRASVYRSLMNIYPTASRREISRAIEEAICLDC
jgi:hypothetical protein